MFDRLVRVRMELRHVAESADALACGLYQLGRLDGPAGRRPPSLLLVDVASVAAALRVGMLLGLIPAVPVRIARDATQVRRIIDDWRADTGSAIGVGRLLYRRHYPLFQPLRQAGCLLVV